MKEDIHMKNIRLFLALLAVAATVAGIILIGNATSFEVGCCFSVASVAYFSTAYLSLKKKTNK